MSNIKCTTDQEESLMDMLDDIVESKCRPDYYGEIRIKLIITEKQMEHLKEIVEANTFFTDKDDNTVNTKGEIVRPDDN